MRIERRFGQPNKHTFLIHPIKLLLDEEMSGGEWVEPFHGFHGRGTVTNDVNPESPATSHLDALEWLLQLPAQSADGVLYDPPYSMYQAKAVYENHGCSSFVTNMQYWSQCRDEIARIIRPGGKVISCGWTSTGISKQRGFAMERILLVPHGGARNDTIVTVECKS